MSKTDSQCGPLTRDEVVSRCGDIMDWQLAAILASGATLEELEEALAWAAAEDDVMMAEDKPLTGRTAAIYEILTSEDEDVADVRR
jgi:hypothetical protein